MSSPDFRTFVDGIIASHLPHCHYRRTIAADELARRYRPGDERPDPEDLGDWQLWYRFDKP